MRKRPSFEFGVSTYLAIALFSFATLASTHAADRVSKDSVSTNTAKMATYDKASGEHFFALSLSLDDSIAKHSPTEVILLIDTSASQVGIYRDDTFATVEAFLKTIGSDTQVKIVAGDLHAISMSQEFAAADSELVKQGIATLNKRVPLGATDLSAILQESLSKFESNSNASRTIVYIGDGTSRANLLSTEEYRDLVKTLTKERVSVNSLAIGPERDIELLATLANHTGGQVFVDSDETAPEVAGAQLAAAATATVIWPEHISFSTNIKESFPSPAPPLRTDRDSILIGTFKGSGDTSVKITGTTSGKPVVLRWTTTPAATSEDYAYFPQLVEFARVNDGLKLPTAGSVGLRESGRLLMAAAESFSQLSRQALVSGDIKAATSLAQAALNRDPGHPQALSVMKVVKAGLVKETEASVKVQQPVVQPRKGILKLNEGAYLTKRSPFQFVSRQVAVADTGVEPEGTFLEDVQERRKVMAKIVQTEVEQSLSNARDKMSSDPSSVKVGMKLLRENILRTPDLDAEMRSNLLNKIVAMIQEASRQEVIVQERDASDGAIRAIGIERIRIIEALMRDEERVRSIMEMFSALMDEGNYKEAADAANAARAIEPLNLTPHVAVFNTELVGNYHDIQAIRELRYVGVIDVLWGTEKSHVPFADEPPIVYPDSEFWEEITRRREKYNSVDLAKTGGAEEKIFNALDEPTKIQFIDTPLIEVIDYLKVLHGIEIQIDTRALDDVGLSSDTPITRNIEGISLRSALRLVLKDLDLTYMVANEVLSITTPDEADAELITKVYPVADLVMPISPQIGGGQGGQQGGQGGQGGGQGGGFGGGGQGGGGQGGGFFAVEDEKSVVKLSDTVEAPVEEKVEAVKPATTKSATAKFKLTLQAGETRLQAWERLMLTGVEIPALELRKEVRRQMQTKQYSHVVELIQLSLRSGYPQPWMYEALGLAMRLNHASDAELERALMSAIDFTSGPEHMLFVATYMARIGLDDRALKLFQEVSQLEPLRPEPYVLGLASAKRLESIEGIKWACVGALKQAWPADNISVKTDAYNTAKATIDRLVSSNKLDEAKEFNGELNKALARDCIARITWTGDADLDLLVEEPGGTICSLRNLRTVSGGVMLGDTTSSLKGTGVDGFSEVYVCPKGFTGEYRMMIRKVWGEITTGKVTVDVYTNYGSENQKHMRKQVDMGASATVVTFELSDGRRTDNLEEHQVQVAAKAHVNLGRAILAQQLNALANDSLATGEYYSEFQERDPTFNRNRRNVGFRPQITTLREGTELGAFAVISADRRYIRFTGAPQFTAIGEVHTFNFATGASTTTPPGGTPTPPVVTPPVVIP